MGENLHGGGLSRVGLVAAGAVASLVFLTLAVFPAAAGAARLYYKLVPDLGFGGGTSVSCPSPSQCTAVSGAQEATFNPAAPKSVHKSRIEPGGQGLVIVVCPSTTQCTAVDGDGREVTFNPAAPSNQTAATIDPVGQSGDTINGLACSSSTSARRSTPAMS